jgi:O-antigen ligase
LLLGTIIFLLQAGIVFFSQRWRSVKAALVYLICLCLLLVVQFSKKYGFVNQDFSVYVSIVITTLPLSLFTSERLLKLIWGTVIAGWLVELLVGLKQSICGEPIAGTLRNPGIYSCYLVVHLPLLYFFYTSYVRNKVKRPLQVCITTLFFALVLLLVCLNKSRSAIVAFLVINLFYFSADIIRLITGYLRKRKRAKIIGIAAGLVILLAGVGLGGYLFHIKKASANGRLLIWEVALSHFPDYWCTGTGFGQAAQLYPEWQAQYFAGNPRPSGDFYLSADDTFIFYNDVLQLLVEIGLLPFIFLGILIAWFFITRIKRGLESTVLTGILIGMLICSFSSYPLHVPYLIFIVFFAFITLGPGRKRFFATEINVGRIPVLVLFCIALAAGAYVLGSVFPRARAVRAIAEVAGGADPKSWVDVLWRQYPVLNEDGKYLVQLGGALLDNNDLDKSIYYLKEGRNRMVGYQSVFLLASACERSNRVDESIAGFQFLSNYIPAKFFPKYELFNLYLIKNDTASAIKIARIILHMPVKIPSFQVDELKNDVLMKYNAIQK